VVCYVSTENLHGTLGVCAEEMTFLRLTSNEQKSLIYGTEFGCEYKVKTIEAVGKVLVFIWMKGLPVDL
jgi:hypothetical protein